jgi:FkbM family methyltransferase
MSIKRKIARVIERELGLAIVPRQEIASLFEENHLRRFFTAFQVDCVFDVGANIGQYAEMLRSRVGYEGTIISYEPIPQIAEQLRNRAKDDPHWHVMELALDQTAGRKTFNVMASDQFSSLLPPSQSETASLAHHNAVVENVSVETRTLAQEFMAQSARLNFQTPFLKMDSQGNDIAIAKGGEDVLGRFAGIQTELAIRRLYEGAPDFMTAISYLRTAGFEVSAFVPNNEGHFPQLIEIDAILIRRDLIGRG